jgi:hypothetical protein
MARRGLVASTLPETCGVTQQLFVVLPAALERSRRGFVEIVAGVYRGVKKDNVVILFGSAEFVLQGWMTIGSGRVDG